jgi:hypothetical protein
MLWNKPLLLALLVWTSEKLGHLIRPMSYRQLTSMKVHYTLTWCFNGFGFACLYLAFNYFECLTFQSHYWWGGKLKTLFLNLKRCWNFITFKIPSAQTPFSQGHKTFYGRTFKKDWISYSVLASLSTLHNVCECGRAYPSVASLRIFEVFRVRLLALPANIRLSWKGQALKHIRPIRKLRP